MKKMHRLFIILMIVIPTLSFLVGCGGKESPPAVTNYHLNLATQGDGNINPSAGTHTFETGTVVNLTATPDVGWKFDSWTGDISGTEATISMTIDGDKSVTANFSKVMPAYVLAASLNGSGTVDPAVGKHIYEAGTVVNITAVPAMGWKFDAWTGDISGTNAAISLTMDVDKSVTANFSKVKYVLTISLNGTGTVEPVAGTYSYDPGTAVNLTATPARGWKFTGWSGGISATALAATVTMDSNKTVVANFSSTIIFEDNFDSENTATSPSKWTVVEPTGTDILIDNTIYFGTSGKSVKILDNSAEAPSMNKLVDTQTGRFWYEVSIRLAQTNQIIGGAYIGNSTVSGGRFGIENLGVSVTFWSDGYIKYNDNDNDLASWKNIQTYQADKWYTIKVFVDVPNQKCNIYIDDVLKLTDVKFRYPMTSLDQISVVGRAELPAATIWIDNVLVSKVE